MPDACAPILTSSWPIQAYIGLIWDTLSRVQSVRHFPKAHHIRQHHRHSSIAYSGTSPTPYFPTLLSSSIPAEERDKRGRRRKRNEGLLHRTGRASRGQRPSHHMYSLNKLAKDKARQPRSDTITKGSFPHLCKQASDLLVFGT
jgi:hypothetical protein